MLYKFPQRLFFIIMVGLGSISCATTSQPDIQTIAAAHQLNFKIITARNGYHVATLSKIINPMLPTHIYLEGDGQAWRNLHQPAANPTPQDLTVINLMSQDNTANLLYVARPCQFVWSAQCHVTDWTAGRYSEAMINAIQAAVLSYPAASRLLIGYSGGAAVALLLLDRIPNVYGLITIAGNLDPDAFSAWHQVSPLTQSLPTNAALLAAAHLPQRHWVGAEDNIIPPILSSQMLAPVRYSPMVQQRVLPGVSHQNGWQAHWADIIREPLPGTSQ